MSTPEPAPADQPGDLPDAEIGLLPDAPGPAGAGEGMTAGADPDAPAPDEP